MADTSVEPNLYQLGLEIGGSPSFHMLGPYTDGHFVVTSPDVDEAALVTALAAHVPDPEIQPDPVTSEPTLDEQLSELTAALNALAGN